MELNKQVQPAGLAEILFKLHSTSCKGESVLMPFLLLFSHVCVDNPQNRCRKIIALWHTKRGIFGK